MQTNKKKGASGDVQKVLKQPCLPDGRQALQLETGLKNK
jgi:hypothetical protein